MNAYRLVDFNDRFQRYYPVVSMTVQSNINSRTTSPRNSSPTSYINPLQDDRVTRMEMKYIFIEIIL